MRMVNEDILTTKETGLYFENKEELNKALKVLEEAGISCIKESASVAFAKSEAYKVIHEFEEVLVENNFSSQKRTLSDYDLSLLTSSILSESINIDCFINELKMTLTNEMIFSNLYTVEMN